MSESAATPQGQPILVLLPDPRLADAMVAALAIELPEVAPVLYRRDLPDATLAPIELAMAWRLPDGLAERMPALRWICATGAGVDKLLVPGLPPQVQVSRVVDPEQAIGMAQYTALMVLRHARGLAGYEAQQRAREWRRQPVAAARHRGLVLGRGEIGRAVAATLQALGFGVACWHTQAGPLAAMLAEADIVVNTLPLTPGTSGLLDARAFAAMPRGAYLVNIARGGHVVEPDLIAAVQGGHLSGAALDVQQTEPLPPDDPLWAVPGISITPHIAAQPSWRTMARQFAQGRACLARGEAPPNLVDRSRGY